MSASVPLTLVEDKNVEKNSVSLENSINKPTEFLISLYKPTEPIETHEKVHETAELIEVTEAEPQKEEIASASSAIAASSMENTNEALYSSDQEEEEV